LSSENNKRIAKNTLLLYFRMLITMMVSFYTSRVVLDTLGVTNFGIYNIVGGVVVLFSMLNGPLSSSTQRYLNFAIGKSDNNQITKIFQSSLTIHLLLIVVFFVLSETVGLWYVNNKLNFPIERSYAVNVVYQLSLILFSVNILRVPYNAVIIAYEKMDFYAYISIFEVLLKLIIVYLLYISNFDKLITYAFLLLIVGVLIFFVFLVYTKRFPQIKFGLLIKGDDLISLLKFSGWSFLGSISVVGAQEGLYLILNFFCGVTINAAVGVANQVLNAIYGFIGNFQVAFNPQLIKLYASNNKPEFENLIIRSSKFSFILFWILSMPIFLFTNSLFHLWLNNVPDFSVQFCRIIILYLVIDAISGPLWVSVQATGKIKSYQILMSLILFINIPIAYLILYLGFSPIYLWVSKVIINFIAFFVRLIYINQIKLFSVLRYVKLVILPVLLVFISSLPLFILIYLDGNLKFPILILYLFLVFVYLLIITFYIGLNKSERTFVKERIIAKLGNKQRP
jgi:O-antigen/teichoic acid export membrane protein